MVEEPADKRNVLEKTRDFLHELAIHFPDDRLIVDLNVNHEMTGDSNNNIRFAITAGKGNEYDIKETLNELRHLFNKYKIPAKAQITFTFPDNAETAAKLDHKNYAGFLSKNPGWRMHVENETDRDGNHLKKLNFSTYVKKIDRNNDAITNAVADLKKILKDTPADIKLALTLTPAKGTVKKLENARMSSFKDKNLDWGRYVEINRKSEPHSRG